MRSCELGTCTRPASWRTKNHQGGNSNPHTMAYCEPCRVELSLNKETLVQLQPIAEEAPLPIKPAVPFVKEKPALNPWGG